MNFEDASSKPQEEGFLSQFSNRQREYLTKAGIDSEVFDLMKDDPAFMAKINSLKNKIEEREVKAGERLKEKEVKAKKIEIAEEETRLATRERQTELQINIFESSPTTSENIAQKTKILDEIQKGLVAVGVDESKMNVGFSPVVEKAFQRVAQNPDAVVEFNFANSKLLVEGVEEIDKNYLVMAAIDSAFQNQIPDSTLAKLDRFEIAKLAQIFESGSFEEDKSVALTPRVVRGFLALARLSDYNFVELQNRGLFDEEWKLQTSVLQNFIELNSEELQGAGQIEVANLSWKKNETLKIEKA